MIPKNLPEDIKAEVFLDWKGQDSYRVSFKGLHKRNAYRDILDLEDNYRGKLLVTIAKKSLYNTLPECLFHPVDRYELPQQQKDKHFVEQYSKQENEKDAAYRFFAPIDILLLRNRLEVREKLEAYTSQNKVLLDLLSDELTESQKSNRFIKRAIPFLLSCSMMRGDRTLLTMFLRKIFFEEHLTIALNHEERWFKDENPQYDESVDSSIDSLYLGNTYAQKTLAYTITFWSEADCDEHFLDFVKEVEDFRTFVQDYFLSVDSELIFNLVDDGPSLRLSDTKVYNYLDYNTNI